MILSGVQQAIDIVLKVLIEPGDPVWMEDPSYPAMHAALRAARAKIIPVPVDQNGLVVSAGIAASPAARAVYVTPSHQYPLGVVLSMARRLELLAWAREARAWVIEDDYDSEVRYAGRPLASLQGIDRGGRVIYLGTFSKVLFPGLRMGYAVFPYELLDAMNGARFLADRHAPGLTEGIVTDFIEHGHFGAHLRRMCAQYRTARDLTAAALTQHLPDTLDIAIPDQGMHLLARLRGGLDDIAVARAALDHGVVVRPVSNLFIAAPPISALMIGFTGYDAPALTAGASRLAAALQA
jgi:GntR family transcriptional regulator/MocR family aminotransferase